MEEPAGAGSARSGLERLAAGDDVPSGDQHVTRGSGLGRVGLAVAARDVGVEAMPGLVGRQACWAASIAAQRNVLGPALGMRPVLELSPDCLIVGASPE